MSGKKYPLKYSEIYLIEIEFDNKKYKEYI